MRKSIVLVSLITFAVGACSNSSSGAEETVASTSSTIADLAETTVPATSSTDSTIVPDTTPDTTTAEQAVAGDYMSIESSLERLKNGTSTPFDVQHLLYTEADWAAADSSEWGETKLVKDGPLEANDAMAAHFSDKVLGGWFRNFVTYRVGSEISNTISQSAYMFETADDAAAFVAAFRANWPAWDFGEVPGADASATIVFDDTDRDPLRPRRTDAVAARGNVVWWFFECEPLVERGDHSEGLAAMISYEIGVLEDAAAVVGVTIP